MKKVTRRWPRRWPELKSRGVTVILVSHRRSS